ncbi:hypothetical protein JCM24511_03317 [Saitozyma sp. JCM 24511]|nr:hypothetical protein JCM24511_03317 [Saitozyma sp. JCM 24511]
MSRTFRTSRHAMDRALLVAVPPEQAPDAPVDPLKWSFHFSYYRRAHTQPAHPRSRTMAE